MAEGGVLVLSNVLCFVANKIGKIPVKTLKSILSDFYDVVVLCEAKVRLLDDIKSLATSVKLPHIPQQRQGDNRIVREINDIITILTRLDEHKLIDQLPRYCASGPDEMPSSRICEGDLNVFMIMLEKLHGKIDEFGSALAAISRDVEVLQTHLPPESFPPLPRADFAQPSRQQTVGNSKYRKSESEISASATGSHSAEQQINTAVPDWAVIASASTPITHCNRFAGLSVDESDDGEYVDPSRRRAKRPRVKSTEQQSQQQPQAHSQQTSVSVAQSRRPPTMFGKSTRASKVSAAGKWGRKSVFCVDNVSMNCGVKDIVSLVRSMSVDVVSCHEVKSRRRRNESSSDNRRAFRLCIWEDERDRLLDSSKWPMSVTVSTWFFKQRRDDADRAGRTEAFASDATGAAVQTEVPRINVGDNVEVREEQDATTDDTVSMSDDTILAQCDDAHFTSDNHGE